MLRSPIFVFLLLFTVCSCTETTKTKASLATEATVTDNSIQAEKFLEFGQENYANQKFDSAFYFFNRSKLLFEVENDSVKIAYNLLQMAIIQQVFGDL